MSPRTPMPVDEDALEDPATAPSDVRVAVSGALIDGRYRIGRELGRGGMSVVYLADHVDLHRQVALKILRPPRRSAGVVDFQAWFKREARTLASIQHPNVVALYDFGKLGPDAFFLAMEHVDGPSLAKLLKAGPLEPMRAVRLMAQAARALRHTHLRGVIHRDVKPSNVLIATAADGTEIVKVIDFGIADAGGEPDGTDDILVGSPHCMAPEQIERKTVGPATDVYSLGVVLFRAITGKWPFGGQTRRETLVAHLVAVPPSLFDFVPDLQPLELDTIVQRCLARDPADRYPDMGALLEDLVALLPEEGGSFDTSTMDVPAIELLPEIEADPARSPWAYLAAGAAVVALALGGWLWLGDASVAPPPEHVGETQLAPTPTPMPMPTPAPAVAPTPVAPEPARSAPVAPPVKRTPHRTERRPSGGATKSPAPKPAPTVEKAPQGYKAMPDF